MSEQVPVQAIRAALAKATPGDWRCAGWHSRTIIPVRWADDAEPPEGRGPFMAATTTTEADAELIVLLRNNAEALLDALETAERRGAVKALRDAAEVFRVDGRGTSIPEATYCEERASEIENGASL